MQRDPAARLLQESSELVGCEVGLSQNGTQCPGWQIAIPVDRDHH